MKREVKLRKHPRGYDIAQCLSMQRIQKSHTEPPPKVLDLTEPLQKFR